MNGGPVQVEDLSAGGTLSPELLRALKDPAVEKRAFNASFERVCLSRLLRDMRWLEKGEFLSPENWRCTMIRCAYMGLPLSLKGIGAVLKLDEQKMEEGANLIRYFCKPCRPTQANGGRTRNFPHHAPEKWALFKR